MSERRISFDTATLDSKILVDDDNYLVMPAVIASEIVHQYEDGWAYKPADELEKMAQTAIDMGSIPIKILEHPGAETNHLLLRQGDVHGRAENFQYVKNLNDPKTGRPMRRGVRADLRWIKRHVPPDILEQIRTFKLRDVSIGFTYDKDMTPGEWNGTHYDYMQRGIFPQHIAGPIEMGRCPGPICGIGFDDILQKFLLLIHVDDVKGQKLPIDVIERVKDKLPHTFFFPQIQTDKVEKRGNQWCVVHCHGEEAGTVIKCFDTEAEALEMHRAIEAQKHSDQGEKPPSDWFENCKNKVMESNPDYSEEQAKATCGDIWANHPEQHGIGDCPICAAIKEVGLPKTAKRLAIAYGVDILSVIRNEKKREAALPTTSLDEDFVKAFGQLKTTLEKK